MLIVEQDPERDPGGVVKRAFPLHLRWKAQAARLVTYASTGLPMGKLHLKPHNTLPSCLHDIQSPKQLKSVATLEDAHRCWARM